MTGSAYGFATIVIPVACYLLTSPKSVVFIALVFTMVFPQWLAPKIGSGNISFSWGLGDIIILAVGLMIFIGYGIECRTISKAKDYDNYYILLFFILLIPSRFIDLVSGVGPLLVVGNLFKDLEPFILFFAVYKWFKGNDKFKIAYWLLAINILINIVAVIQITNPTLYSLIIHNTTSADTASYIDTFMFGRVASTLMNPGTFAWYLTIMTPFLIFQFLKKEVKIRMAFLIVCIWDVILLIFTLSRTQWLALLAEGVVLFVYLLKTAKRKSNMLRVTIFIAVIIGLGIYVMNEYGTIIYRRINLVNVENLYQYGKFTLGYSMAFRIEALKAGIYALKSNWLFGAGQSNIISVLHQAMIDSGTSLSFISSSPSLHNQVLNYVLRCGVPLGVLVIRCWIRLYRHYVKNQSIRLLINMLFVGLLVSGLTGEILNSARILSIVFIIFAYCKVEIEEDGKIENRVYNGDGSNGNWREVYN